MARALLGGRLNSEAISMAITRSYPWFAWALTGLMAGCSNSGDRGTSGDGAALAGDAPEPTPHEGKQPMGAAPNGTAGGGGPRTVPVAVGKAAAALVRASDCDDLLARIQDDVVAKIEMQAELMRKEPDYGGTYPPGIAVGVASRGAPEAVPLPAMMAPAPGIPANDAAATPTTPAASGTDNAASGAKGASGPTDFSETNTQVKGVDEADIVKTDGEHIYLLHGNQLFVLDSWPADMTAITSKADVEGNALEMFVQDGIAVVFSSIYDQGDLIEPRPNETDDQAKGIVPIGYRYGSSFTKITLIDVKSDSPKVQRELFVQGDYLSARRHGDLVRTVIRDGSRFPEFYGGAIEYRDPWGRPYSQEEIDAQVDDWRDRTAAAAENTKLSDWLPTERELKGGKLVDVPARCDDFYVPAAGLANGGVTNLLSFDMTDPKSELGGALVMGVADEVYANDDVMVLAQRDWRWERQLIERERTVLHRFEISGDDTVYTASGAVPGHIIDQFSIDEWKGVIRVATTAQFWPNFIAPLPAVADAAAADDPPSDAQNRRETENRVITLGVDGDKLERLGMTEPLGKDGEVIQSTRFVDDTGYVVTFERVDPLIVVDLENPMEPTVLGQLDIPGFSEYMHPLDADHLLTIGQDASTDGRVLGLILQIFDVSDATKPVRTHSYRFGPNGYSEAGQNHKAFTFHKPEGAQGYDGLLAFPYVNYNGNFESSLQVFQVSATSGFTQLGAVDHTAMLREVCRPFVDAQVIDGPGFYPCVSPEVRRGLFIFGDDGDFVYSISNGGVLVHALTDLVDAVASVPLPMPDYNDHRVFRGPGAAAPGGSGSAATPPVAPTPPPMMTPAPQPPKPQPKPQP
jgi:hypothetical protein